jgi:competence protein ComFC
MGFLCAMHFALCPNYIMFLDLFFPKKCLGCNKSGLYICESCLKRVGFSKPICPVCKRASIDGFTHSGCLLPRNLDGLVCIWNYEKVIKKAIWAVKYRYAYQISNEVAKYARLYLKNALQFKVIKNIVLVPIPSHKKRKNWRGFNQSEVLGKLIADKMGWKYLPDLLIRRKLTVPQMELKGKARVENIKGVFALNPHYSLFTRRYQLILFDDVYTTGSTLKEACKVLKRNGFKTVWGLAIAR